VSAGNAALLAGIALVPLVVLTLTSFVKISVVLSLVRNAIGAPEAPSGLVVTGLSLVLTFFVMAPVAIAMIDAATAPPPAVAPPASELDVALRKLVPAEYQPDLDTAERAEVPLRAWLTAHAAQRDRETFVELAGKLGHTTRGDEMWVVAPAFVTSELREAFAIAVLVFLPFVVIDLIVGLGLSALGLQVTNPQTVALPLKLLLFVAVDGWRLLIDGLLRGYA
jgi:type III secretion protein R